MEDAYDDIATESILTNADKAAEDLPLFPEEEWYEQLLRYGLYLGALFQIICILAVIVSPSSDIKDDLNVNNYYIPPIKPDRLTVVQHWDDSTTIFLHHFRTTIPAALTRIRTMKATMGKL
jgi:hypothetical protein